jgi:enoyl-CoA hydratase/carnithine racemase
MIASMSDQAAAALAVHAGSQLLVRCHEETLDAATAATVAAVLRRASHDDSTGVVVLQVPRALSGTRSEAPAFNALLQALRTSRKPIVALIEHDVCVEAMPMVALSDAAIMLEQARLFGGFASTETTIETAVLQRLRLSMGHPKAFELVTLPRPWSSHECLRCGVVSGLAADREVFTGLGFELAEKVAYLSRAEAWRTDRNYFGRASAAPLSRAH